MKRQLVFAVAAVTVTAAACKKEAAVKPPAKAPEKTEAAKPKPQPVTSGATYDYQKAIMAKRTINVKPN